MQHAQILAAAEAFVKERLAADSSGHDWWHIYRVTRTAKMIAAEEGADECVCVLSAVLHDIADEKLNESKESGLAIVRNWLTMNEVDARTADHIMEIISTISFNGGHNAPVTSLEAQVVQDADRIDAIGAIGIARTFAYAGAKGHLIHDPQTSPRERMTQEQYRSGSNTAINHFYEKLLKLKNLMNTRYGKQMAEERHQVMEQFLQQFHMEWEVQK